MPMPMPLPPAPLRRLVDDVLTVDEVAPDRFRGGLAERVFDRMYGGQLLAQALLAASATVPPRLEPNSFHGYFVRLGDPDAAVEYTVNRTRDATGSAHRAIEATQGGRILATALCSYREPFDGLGDGHQHAPPASVGPDDLESRDDALRERFAGAAVPANAGLAWPFDMRYVDQRPWDDDRQARNRLWLRAAGDVPDDPLVHRALLLYASDLAMFEPVVAPLDLAWEDLIAGHGVFGASLDHSLWFHRQPRVDDWMLEVQHSPVATGSRGLSLAHFYDPAGRLVATAAQEILVQRTAPSAHDPAGERT